MEVAGRVQGNGRLATGMMRGVVAAMAMSAVRQVTTNLGLVEQTPPDAILKQRSFGMLLRAPRLAYFVARREVALVELAHWTYGAMGGIAFTMLPPSAIRQRWIGVGYGALTWVVFEVSVAPILGLAQTRRIRIIERVTFLGDHLLYGVILAGNRSWALPRRHRLPFGRAATKGWRR